MFFRTHSFYVPHLSHPFVLFLSSFLFPRIKFALSPGFSSLSHSHLRLTHREPQFSLLCHRHNAVSQLVQSLKSKLTRIHPAAAAEHQPPVGVGGSSLGRGVVDPRGAGESAFIEIRTDTCLVVVRKNWHGSRRLFIFLMALVNILLLT